VFIQIIQGRCSRPDDLRAQLDKWRTDCEPGAEGFLGGTYGMTDDNMFVGVVRFESRELAMANSNRPEQSAWWAETAPLFDASPEFHDCDNVMLMMDGGSDQAGFVQVIRGKVDEPERLKAMLEETTSMLHEARPEIIGATIAIEEDGTFTETVAFTDEESARRGEQLEMPEALRGWQSSVHDLTYLDLHHPWFATHRTDAG